MSETGRLPTASKSQTIGFKAAKCFEANCPDAWLPKSTDGADDFGIDYQVQVLINEQASDIFRVQLKGTIVPDLNAGETHFSIQLKASTIRYYARFTEPILLVLCDLSVNPVAIKCPLYYVWIHDELRRVRLSELCDQQGSVNLWVPKANILSAETDFSRELSQARALANIGISMDMTLEAREPAWNSAARATLLKKVPAGFSERSAALMESLAEGAATVWPDRPVNSMAWHLHEAEQKLNLGAVSQAEAILTMAEGKLGIAVQLELAEYWYLKGKVHAANLSHQEACKAFEQAMIVSPSQPRYIAAWAETKLSTAFSDGGSQDIREIYVRLTSPAPAVLSIKARALAVEKRYEEAHQVLATFSGVEQLAALALVHTMQSNSADAILVCDAGLAIHDIKESTKLLFIIIKARAQFNLAIGNNPDGQGEQIIVPITGWATTDHELLHLAWCGMEAAMERLRATGWPPNIEFVADMVCATAPILRKEQQALTMLAAAAEKRPALQTLQTAVELLATQIGNFELAMRANARLHPNSETKLRRVLQLHMADKDAECISLFETELPNFDQSSPTFAQSLTVALLSAHRLVRTDLIKSWVDLFNGSPELMEQRAVWEYFASVLKSRGKRDQALDILFKSFESGNQSRSLAIHLFEDLSPHNEEDAEKLIRVAEVLTKDRQLPLDGLLNLGQALTTLGRWPELLILAQNAQKRFSGHPMLIAVAALALDKLGQTAEARATLLPLVEGGATEPFILGTHIEIAIRCGFTEEAVAAAEKLVSTAAEVKKKVHHLKLLHSLVRANNPKDPRAHDIAWRIGELIEPEDEKEEGAFLIMLMLSSPPEHPDIAQIVEYQERLRSYTTRFPHSSILRSAQISDRASAEELIASLSSLAGETVEGLEAKRRMREERDAVQRHVVFSWRPAVYSSVALDLPQLWEMSKKAKGSDWKLLLSMASGSWEAMPFDALHGKVPLMDLLSLLVAHDLKILDLIFKLFPKIAIAQRSMFEIGRLADPLNGSPSSAKCRDIQSTLKRNFGQILQPRVSVEDLADERNVEILCISAEMKMVSHQHPYLMYSDDAYFRFYCQEADQDFKSICVLDILAAMEHRKLLTTREVAKRIGMLCSWGVATAIRQSWQVAVLPRSVGKAKNIAAGLELLRSSKLCIAMFDAMWDGAAASYNDLLSHAGNLYALMVRDKHQNVISIASLMALWHEKAIRNPDAPPDSLASLAFLARTAAAAIQEPHVTFVSSRRIWQTFFLLVEHDQGKSVDEAVLVDAVSMLAGAIGNYDLNIKAFWQPSLKAFFDSGLDDRGFLKGVLNAGYKIWAKSLMHGRVLSAACYWNFEPCAENRPHFWSDWHKSSSVPSIIWRDLPRSLNRDNDPSFDSQVTRPLDGNYQQGWRSFKLG